MLLVFFFFFFFQAEDGIRDGHVTGVQTCALPISDWRWLWATIGSGGYSSLDCRRTISMISRANSRIVTSVNVTDIERVRKVWRRFHESCRCNDPSLPIHRQLCREGAGASRAWSLHRPTSFPIGGHGQELFLTHVRRCANCPVQADRASVLRSGGRIRQHLAVGLGHSPARNRTEPSLGFARTAP